MRTLALGVAICLVIASPLVEPGTSAAKETKLKLDLLWTSPITGEPPPPPVGTTTRGFDIGTGVALSSGVTAGDGRLMFLVNKFAPNSRTQALLVDAERGDRVVNLKLEGAVPESMWGFVTSHFGGNKPRGLPGIDVIALGKAGEIWVGGSANGYYNWASAWTSNPYLAKIDENGHPLWEKAYKNDGYYRMNIRSMSAIPSGGVAVFGSYDRDGWLGRIDAEGKLLWEQRLPIHIGGAVVVLPDERIAVVGFESSGRPPTKDYRDDVSLWIFDGSGKEIVHTRIRPSMNNSAGAYYGTIGIAASKDAIYLTSSWEYSDTKPVSVSKVGFDGALIWSADLPDTTVVTGKNFLDRRSCTSTLTVGVDGNPILVCGLEGLIHLYQFDGTGTYRESKLPLPPCQTDHPAKLFVVERDKGSMALIGTRPGGNVAENCTWVGRLVSN